jgi:hypothetical protein
MTVCCMYPTLVIWRWQFNHCKHECESAKDNGCCINVCTMKAVHFIETTEDGAIVNLQGIARSYMLSIGNASFWEPVINDSVEQCSSKYVEKNRQFKCEVIPNKLYKVIECSYRENYLNCPVFNLYRIPQCEHTMSYVRECMESDDSEVEDEDVDDENL